MVTSTSRSAQTQPRYSVLEWLREVCASDTSTRNALRLARWVAPTLVLTLLIAAAALVGLALASPLAAAGLLGGGSIATGGSLVAFSRRSRHGSSTADR